MTAGFHADWERLWQIAQSAEASLGDVGLFVESPAEPRRGTYDATPPGSVMVASTGGDGVHFSLLTTTPAAPVVMTVPMAFDSPNHVLGADLREFLALGCHTGYFGLERLAYGWGRESMIEKLATAPAPAPERADLRRLIDEFGLRPWPDVPRRLAELDALFA